ncbi:oxidoreductase [Streptomyces rapamycinicus]|uniref:oxidoreductase n=1 Tax=Streptomyces rapamycinicus TaxID=1226757 RepID=UPI00237B85F9|nr:hypothetical protein [Streptomyces rapamycinicus]
MAPYGGSSEKRAQFLFDVVDAVGSVWGSDRIGVKLSPYWRREPAFTADAEMLTDYDLLLKRLSDTDLAYLHLVGPEPDTGTDDTFTAFTHYRGAVIANLGFTQASGNELLERQLADAVSFGAPFIANPDLVDRFTHGHPLAAGSRDTYFAGGAEGYTDYPAVAGSYYSRRRQAP